MPIYSRRASLDSGLGAYKGIWGGHGRLYSLQGRKTSKDSRKSSSNFTALYRLPSVAGGGNTNSRAGNKEYERPADGEFPTNAINGGLESEDQRHARHSSTMDAGLHTVGYGRPGSLEYRMSFFLEDGQEISPWHSIPLRQGTENLLNCICKTPAGRSMRYEIAQNEPFNPLRVAEQTAGTGKPARYSNNCPWNLGVVPQTWADPELLGIDPNDSQKCLFAEKSPVELVDIGDVVEKRTGNVYPVKPLAAFLVLEGGMWLSWKVVAISVDDPLSDLLHNVADLNTVLPGTLCEVRDWLRGHHSFEPGLLETSFPFGDQPIDASEAVGAIARAHAAWKTKIAHSPLAPSPLASGLPHAGELPLEQAKAKAKAMTERTTWDTKGGVEANPVHHRLASAGASCSTLILHDPGCADHPSMAEPKEDLPGGRWTLPRTRSSPFQQNPAVEDPDASSVGSSFHSGWSSSSSSPSTSTSMAISSDVMIHSIYGVLGPARSLGCSLSAESDFPGLSAHSTVTNAAKTRSSALQRRARSSLFSFEKALGLLRIRNRSPFSQAVPEPAAALQQPWGPRQERMYL